MNLKAALYTVTTTPINGSSSYGQVTLWVPEQVGTADTICWAGHASGLGVDVRSTYGGGGDDCTAANGCGVHVHAGFSCADSTSQGEYFVFLYRTFVAKEDFLKLQNSSSLLS